MYFIKMTNSVYVHIAYHFINWYELKHYVKHLSDSNRRSHEHPSSTWTTARTNRNPSTTTTARTGRYSKNIITARKRSLWRLCFHRCMPHCMLGYTPHREGTPPRQAPPGLASPLGRHSPGQTPPAQAPPSCAVNAGGRHPTRMQSCFWLLSYNYLLTKST